jgi:hypothetical protein
MSDQQAFQYQRILTLSPKAFNHLKVNLWQIKAAHPDMPFFFFTKGAREVKIFGHTPTETIKFSFIVSAFLMKRGFPSSEIQMSDPVPIPQGAPMGGAGGGAAAAPAVGGLEIPLANYAANGNSNAFSGLSFAALNHNVGRLPTFAAPAPAPAPAAAAAAAPRSIETAANTNTNVGGAAIPGLSGGNRRRSRSTRRLKKSRQSRKARQSMRRA